MFSAEPKRKDLAEVRVKSAQVGGALAPNDLCIRAYFFYPMTPAEGWGGSDNPISRSDPSAGVKQVVNMLLHTGRSGLTPLRPVPI